MSNAPVKWGVIQNLRQFWFRFLAQCVSWHLNWMHFVVHLDFEKLFPLVKLLLWCSISDSEAEITTLPLGWEEAFGGSRADALSAWLKSEQESRGWAWQMLYYKKLGRYILCQLLNIRLQIFKALIISISKLNRQLENWASSFLLHWLCCTVH